MKYNPVGPASRAELRAALLDHYDLAARDLPWRADTDPYRVLVSEIMLQQTRVDTVTGYYGPWLERFPTVADLASAEEDEVLKAWEGLGYYRRARNLHRAARVVREEHGGTIPGTFEELRGLPGIGEYTAGAVASIAFDEAVPAVDGNVKRVLARLFDVVEPTPAWLRDRAHELVHPERPGDWNQAVMELGATVCTPRAPKCEACPVAAWCAARAAGTQAERPAPPRRRPVPTAEIVLAVIHRAGRVLLEKRPPKGLLAGMWAFPERRVREEATTGGSASDAGAPGTTVEGAVADEQRGEAAALSVAQELGYTAVTAARALERCRHRFTHLEVVYLPWALKVSSEEPTGGRETAWVDARDPGQRALPRAQQRVLESWTRTIGSEIG